jgi:uncharacterized membrane protein
MKERIPLIDALRGLSVFLMVAYHFGINLILFAGAPDGLIYNPLLDFLQPVFAGIFITLAGLSCRFSRKNLKRGVMLVCLGIGVTVVTAQVGFAVQFGILTFLGVGIILYDLASPLLKRIPWAWLACASITLFAVAFAFFPRHTALPMASHVWMLGFRPAGFSSADYFPLLPWVFLIFFGSAIAEPVLNRRLPAWFYRANPPVLPFLGRHTLIIYLAHQPIMYGIFMLWPV